jgi:hypothetical protein
VCVHYCRRAPVCMCIIIGVHQCVCPRVLPSAYTAHLQKAYYTIAMIASFCERLSGCSAPLFLYVCESHLRVLYLSMLHLCVGEFYLIVEHLELKTL